MILIWEYQNVLSRYERYLSDTHLPCAYLLGEALHGGWTAERARLSPELGADILEALAAEPADASDK